MTRKLWMTLGALTLFVAAGTAHGSEQNREAGRKLLCQERKAARQEGLSRREAKARAWRQIIEARATVAAYDWQVAFDNLSNEVLIVATELAQTGHHKAAMTLLQRVINAVPGDADIGKVLARICSRGPRDRSSENELSDAIEQEFEAATSYQSDYSSILANWIECLQQASSPAANGKIGAGVPCTWAAPGSVPGCAFCCPFTGSCPIATSLPAAAEYCACGPALLIKKPVKPVWGMRNFARLAMGLNCCNPIFGSVTYVPMNYGVAVACSADTCVDPTRTRVEVVNVSVASSDVEEIQDVTVIRYSQDGTACQRQYQVHRTLTDDRQGSARIERLAGTLGRFVHHISSDTTGNTVANMYDFVPCVED